MKKILSVILASLMVLSLFACGNNQSSQNGQKVKKLIMCTNATFPPYEYKDGNEFKGIDVEVAKIIGEKLGCEVEILDIEFDALIPAVMSGKADFAMAGMTVTEDRKQNINFSETYQKAVQAIIVPDDSPIKTIDDMNGKKVGVQSGTTGDIYCSGDFGEENVVRYSKIPDAMLALKTKKIDVVVVDDQVAKTLVETNGEGYKILDTPYAEEEYAIGINKNNTELLNNINQVIKEIKSNGQLKTIVDKYIN